MDDEPKVQQLENRIDSLESTIKKMMPSRRDALKMGGAALVGGSLMAGTASADTVDDQVGTIGGPNEEVDLVSEDIDNSNQITTKDLVVLDTIRFTGDPPGSLIEKTSDQNMPQDTVVTVDFDTTTRGIDLLNANNDIVMPSGFSYAKITPFLRFAFDAHSIDNLTFKINGTSTQPRSDQFAGGQTGDDNTLGYGARRRILPPTPWFDIEAGDVLTLDIRNRDNATEIESGTYLEIQLI